MIDRIVAAVGVRVDPAEPERTPVVVRRKAHERRAIPSTAVAQNAIARAGVHVAFRVTDNERVFHGVASSRVLLGSSMLESRIASLRRSVFAAGSRDEATEARDSAGAVPDPARPAACRIPNS